MDLVFKNHGDHVTTRITILYNRGGQMVDQEMHRIFQEMINNPYKFYAVLIATIIIIGLLSFLIGYQVGINSFIIPDNSYNPINYVANYSNWN